MIYSQKSIRQFDFWRLAYYTLFGIIGRYTYRLDNRQERWRGDSLRDEIRGWQICPDSNRRQFNDRQEGIALRSHSAKKDYPRHLRHNLRTRAQRLLEQCAGGSDSRRPFRCLVVCRN